jgi:hypothetical protein
VALASSPLKIQPTGTYVAWAYPFLLIGIFAGRQTARRFGVTDDGAGAAAWQSVAQVRRRTETGEAPR